MRAAGKVASQASLSRPGRAVALGPESLTVVRGTESATAPVFWLLHRFPRFADTDWQWVLSNALALSTLAVPTPAVRTPLGEPGIVMAVGIDIRTVKEVQGISEFMCGNGNGPSYQADDICLLFTILGCGMGIIRTIHSASLAKIASRLLLMDSRQSALHFVIML